MDSVRQTLQKLVADFLNRLPVEQVPVEAWQFVCGKQVADRTRAIAFAEGVLRVEVPDAGWRAQLQDLSGRYLASLNQYSATRIQRIDFVLAHEPGSRSADQYRGAEVRGKWRESGGRRQK